MSVLSYITSHPHCRISDIMDATGHDAAAVWNQISRLTREGKVLRHSSTGHAWTFTATEEESNDLS